MLALPRPAQERRAIRHDVHRRLDPRHARPGGRRAYRDLATQLNRNQRDLTDGPRSSTRPTCARATHRRARDGQRLDETRAELAALRQTVKSRAAFIYTHASTPATAIVDIEHVQDISAGKQYAESATRRDVDKIGDLTTLANSLDQRRRDLTDTRTAQEAARDRLQKSKDDLDALVAKQTRLLDHQGDHRDGRTRAHRGADVGMVRVAARCRLMDGMTITGSQGSTWKRAHSKSTPSGYKRSYKQSSRPARSATRPTTTSPESARVTTGQIPFMTPATACVWPDPDAPQLPRRPIKCGA